MGRRKACLGTPVPMTLIVAPGPKACSELASRRSQGASAASVDAWRLMGRGRLRFPMLPRQLSDLMSPCCMQRKIIITYDRGDRRLAFSCYK